MRVLEVTYDLDSLNDPDYGGLSGALDRLDSLHAFQSTWYVFTNWTESELAQLVRQFMNDDDHFRVSQVTTVGAGRMPKRMWDWLTNRLARCKKGLVLKSRLPAPIKVNLNKMFES